MSTVRTGFGLALVAALALVNGCAPAQLDGPPSEEAVEASTDEPQIVYTCSLGGGMMLASLQLFTHPSAHPTCAITIPELPNASRVYCQPNTPGPVCPDCAALRAFLGCFAV